MYKYAIVRTSINLCRMWRVDGERTIAIIQHYYLVVFYCTYYFYSYIVNLSPGSPSGFESWISLFLEFFLHHRTRFLLVIIHFLYYTEFSQSTCNCVQNFPASSLIRLPFHQLHAVKSSWKILSMKRQDVPFMESLIN